jgi:hypothetical protein
MGNEITSAELFVGAGSFWTNHAQKQEQAKVESVISLVLNNTLLKDIEAIGRGLGTLEDQLVRSEVYTYNFEDAFMTFSSPGSTPVPYIAGDIVVAQESFHVVKWTLDDVTPTAIRTQNGDVLGLNIDYWYSDGYLWFTVPSEELFLENSFIIESGVKNVPSWYAYLLRTKTPYKNTDLIEYFYKGQRDLRGLELATHVVAGMPILRQAGTVVLINDIGEGSRYFMDTGEVLDVPFSHDKFTVGEFLRENTVVRKGGVEFIMPDPENPLWYRATNWEYGLSLQGLTIFEGLVVPDKLMPAYSVGEDPGSLNASKLHARMVLVGHWDTQEEYWETVSKAETESGYYINSIVGLEPENQYSNYTIDSPLAPGGLLPCILGFPNTELVNPLEVYFEAILKDKTFIVVIDETKVDNKQEIIDFINDNVIDGIYPIIRIKKSDGGYVDYQIEKFYRTYEFLADENGVALAMRAESLQRDVLIEDFASSPAPAVTCYQEVFLSLSSTISLSLDGETKKYQLDPFLQAQGFLTLETRPVNFSLSFTIFHAADSNLYLGMAIKNPPVLVLPPPVDTGVTWGLITSNPSTDRWLVAPSGIGEGGVTGITQTFRGSAHYEIFRFVDANTGVALADQAYTPRPPNGDFPSNPSVTAHAITSIVDLGSQLLINFDARRPSGNYAEHQGVGLYDIGNRVAIENSTTTTYTVSGSVSLVFGNRLISVDSGGVIVRDMSTAGYPILRHLTTSGFGVPSTFAAYLSDRVDTYLGDTYRYVHISYRATYTTGRLYTLVIKNAGAAFADYTFVLSRYYSGGPGSHCGALVGKNGFLYEASREENNGDSGSRAFLIKSNISTVIPNAIPSIITKTNIGTMMGYTANKNLGFYSMDVNAATDFYVFSPYGSEPENRSLELWDGSTHMHRSMSHVMSDHYYSVESPIIGYINRHEGTGNWLMTYFSTPNDTSNFYTGYVAFKVTEAKHKVQVIRARDNRRGFDYPTSVTGVVGASSSAGSTSNALNAIVVNTANQLYTLDTTSKIIRSYTIDLTTGNITPSSTRDISAYAGWTGSVTNTILEPGLHYTFFLKNSTHLMSISHSLPNPTSNIAVSNMLSGAGTMCFSYGYRNPRVYLAMLGGEIRFMTMTTGGVLGGTTYVHYNYTGTFKAMIADNSGRLAFVTTTGLFLGRRDVDFALATADFVAYADLSYVTYDNINDYFVTCHTDGSIRSWEASVAGNLTLVDTLVATNVQDKLLYNMYDNLIVGYTGATFRLDQAGQITELSAGGVSNISTTTLTYTKNFIYKANLSQIDKYQIT